MRYSARKMFLNTWDEDLDLIHQVFIALLHHVGIFRVKCADLDLNLLDLIQVFRGCLI